jgi:hypothetical protein
MLPLLAIGAGAAAVKGIAGAIQTSKANKALAEINKTAAPDYTEDPRLTQAYNQAQAMSNRGYTAEESNAFKQQLARTQMAQKQSALDLTGGQMGGAINSVLNANQTGAINQFAAQDAGLRRQNMAYAGGLAQAVQSQQNMINQQKIARRQMLEQAYGTAAAQGKENMFGAFDSLTNVAVAGMGGKSQGATTTIETETLVDEFGNPITAE